MNNLLLFDYNSLLFKSVAIHKDYRFGKHYTGGIYGFINQLCKNINIFNPDYFVVCSDKPPYIRKDVYPDYKANRKKDPEIYEKIKESRFLIDEFIELTNIPFWSIEGLEADDLFAVMCKHHNDLFDKITIVSNDDDLYQLLTYNNIELWANNLIINKHLLQEKYKISKPEDWVKITAMSGTHNNIPGLKGIGKTTAIKLYHKPDAFEKVWEDNKEILDFYYSLIKLPIKKVEEIVELRKAKFDLRTAINYLTRLGIDIKPHMMKAFEYLEEEGKK
jgi:DNA polymerase-1